MTSENEARPFIWIVKYCDDLTETIQLSINLEMGIQHELRCLGII